MCVSTRLVVHTYIHSVRIKENLLKFFQVFQNFPHLPNIATNNIKEHDHINHHYNHH